MIGKSANFRSGYLLTCLAFALGAALGLWRCELAELWPYAAAAAALAGLFGYGLDRRWLLLAGVFAIALAAAWHREEERVDFIGELRLKSRPHVALMKVESVECRGEWVSFVSEISGVGVRAIMKRRRGFTHPRPGEVWRCAGWLERGDVHDRRLRTFWMRGKGTFARRVSAAEHSAVGELRRRLSRGLGYGLRRSPVAADLNRAIFLGERERLPRALKRSFVGAGTMHVFAISGLHVMVVARIIEFVILGLFFPYRWTALPVVPALWGYVYAIGMGPSAVRAAMMASIISFATLFRRRGDALVAWSLTFLAVHLLDPAQLLRIGSVLSFVVMLGILLFLRWTSGLGFKKPLMAVGVTTAAWVAGTPISVWCFGQITPGGLLANLAVIQLVPFSVVFSALGAVSSAVSVTLAGHFNNAAAIATELMIWISRTVAGWHYANFEIGHLPVWAHAVWYAGFGLAAWMVRRLILSRRSIL